MRVQLLVTKTDFNLSNLEKEFQDIGIDYEVAYIEEHPELVSIHHIRHSPNILVDGRLAFQRQPTETELRNYFQALS
jgi:hypothetical protein